MPPKAKYTKEEIIDVAYGLVRKYGIEFLSSRTLAAELGTSTAPIFTAFNAIEDLQREIIERAKAEYKEYIREGLTLTPAFKSAGLQYIRFAKEEPELFKMLFMSSVADESPSHYYPGGDENEPIIRGAFENNYAIDTERAKRIYNHLSVYVHGIAVLYAQGRCVFTDEDVSVMLSEMFMALVKGEKI